MTTSSILRKLKGGDRRSIGRPNEFVAEALARPELCGALFAGLSVDDPIMRLGLPIREMELFGEGFRQIQLVGPLGFQIDLLEGTELFRQFCDPLIASTNFLPKRGNGKVLTFGNFRSPQGDGMLLFKPGTHEPFHHR